VAGGILNRQVSITTWLPDALRGSIMRPQMRGWIMPEADMRSMLRLIDEKINSKEIETRHCDALIRLREMLESDLNGHRADSSADQQEADQETAA
jgi:hypothetical protein